MKKKQLKGNFEKQINLLIERAMLQISDKEIQTSWEMLERRIKAWEKHNVQQQDQPNHHQDVNMLGESAGKT